MSSHQPPRSTQPSTLCAMVKWVSAFGLSSINKRRRWIVDDIAAYGQIHSPSLFVWSEPLRVNSSLALSLHSSYEPSELLQWPIIAMTTAKTFSSSLHTVSRSRPFGRVLWKYSSCYCSSKNTIPVLTGTGVIIICYFETHVRSTGEGVHLTWCLIDPLILIWPFVGH